MENSSKYKDEQKIINKMNKVVKDKSNTLAAFIDRTT